MNIARREEIAALMTEKTLWAVSLLPGSVVIDNPDDLLNKIIWVPKEESGEGITEAKIYDVVPNSTKEHAIEVNFYFKSTALKDNITPLEHIKIEVSLEHYPKKGQKVVVIIESKIKEMAASLSYLDG